MINVRTLESKPVIVRESIKRGFSSIERSIVVFRDLPMDFVNSILERCGAPVVKLAS